MNNTRYLSHVCATNISVALFCTFFWVRLHVIRLATRYSSRRICFTSPTKLTCVQLEPHQLLRMLLKSLVYGSHV